MQAVVFDAVGTLLIPAPPVGEVYAAAAAQFAVPQSSAELTQKFRTAFAVQERIDQHNGWRVSESRELERWRSIVFECIPDIEEAGFTALYDHFAKPESWQVTEEVETTLDQLQEQGVQLGLASNFDYRLFTIVAALPELYPLRDGVIVSSRVGYRKPHPAFFAAVTAVLQCPAEATLFVGDDPLNDFEGARNAGFQPVLYDPGNRHPNYEPRCRRLGELLNYLR